MVCLRNVELITVNCNSVTHTAIMFYMHKAATHRCDHIVFYCNLSRVCFPSFLRFIYETISRILSESHHMDGIVYIAIICGDATTVYSCTYCKSFLRSVSRIHLQSTGHLWNIITYRT